MSENNLIEFLSEKVHNSWWEEKKNQGFHAPLKCPKAKSLPAENMDEYRDIVLKEHCEKCHPDMYEYKSLPENIKEYDRATVRAVLSALSEYFSV